MTGGRRGTGPGLVWLLALALGMCSPPASGAGWREVEGAWLMPPDLAVVILGGDHEATGGRPWQMSLGTGQLFALPELDQRSLGLQWRGRLGGAPAYLRLRWSRLGRGPYSESLGACRLMLGRCPGFGLTLEQTWMAIAGEAVRSAPRLDFLMGYQWKCEAVGRFWLRMAHPFPGKSTEAPRAPRRRSFLEAGWRKGGQALVVQWDQDERGRPLLGGDLLWRVGPRVGLGLRWDPATGSLGPGLQFLGKGLLLRTSHMVHPWLGVSHRFSLGLGGGHDEW